MSRIEDISSASVTSLAMPRAKHHSAGRRLRALAGTVAVAALIACGLNGAALAEDAKIKSMSFETLTPYKKNTIQVTSSTGAK